MYTFRKEAFERVVNLYALMMILMEDIGKDMFVDSDDDEGVVFEFLLLVVKKVKVELLKIEDSSFFSGLNFVLMSVKNFKVYI